MKKILWAITLSIGTSAWIEAQTIADFARQERARQAKTESIVVATSDMIKTQGTEQQPAAPKGPDTDAAKEPAKEPAKAQTPGADAAAPKAAATPERDEKWWRGEFAKANESVKRSEDQIKVLELELSKANRDYLQRSDIYNREGRIGAEIKVINGKIDAAKKDADTARQKKSQLEEDLRRSGGPPGWAR
jgi:hypothetical protein